MEYTLKKWEENGSLRDKGNDTSDQPIIITPQIVGDKYGFIAPDPGRNMTIINIPNKGYDIDQLKEYIQPLAQAFCAQQYPNT